VRIHADESCLGNQFEDRANPGGAGALVETWVDDQWVRRDLWLSESGTTNNRMALRSAIEPFLALTRGCQVLFVSDSQYLVRGFTEWRPSWKRRGWKRKTGPIENLDLWKELDEVATRHTIEWRWTKGHAGHAYNEYADMMAVRAATELTTSEGFAESGFLAWLASERSDRRRYLDFNEDEPPA